MLGLNLKMQKKRYDIRNKNLSNSELLDNSSLPGRFIDRS